MPISQTETSIVYSARKKKNIDNTKDEINELEELKKQYEPINKEEIDGKIKSKEKEREQAVNKLKDIEDSLNETKIEKDSIDSVDQSLLEDQLEQAIRERDQAQKELIDSRKEAREILKKMDSDLEDIIDSAQEEYNRLVHDLEAGMSRKIDPTLFDSQTVGNFIITTGFNWNTIKDLINEKKI